MNDNKNTILAIVLSAVVLIGWQYFVGMPQEKSRQEQLQVQQQKQGTPTPAQDAAGTRTIRNPAGPRSGSRALGRRACQPRRGARSFAARSNRNR